MARVYVYYGPTMTYVHRYSESSGLLYVRKSCISKDPYAFWPIYRLNCRRSIEINKWVPLQAVTINTCIWLSMHKDAKYHNRHGVNIKRKHPSQVARNYEPTTLIGSWPAMPFCESISHRLNSLSHYEQNANSPCNSINYNQSVRFGRVYSLCARKYGIASQNLHKMHKYGWECVQVGLTFPFILVLLCFAVSKTQTKYTSNPSTDVSIGRLWAHANSRHSIAIIFKWNKLRREQCEYRAGLYVFVWTSEGVCVLL